MKLLLLMFCISEFFYSPQSSVVKATGDFALSFFQALSNENKGNVFVSPLSVQMILALIYTGSRGKTAEEVKKLLSLPDELEDTLGGYSSLLRDLDKPVLKIANRLFVEESSPVKEEFQKNAEEYFQSAAESLDFGGNAEKAREHINSWVESKTNNKIKDILEPGNINNLTKLVLVNAIHFKAGWRFKFPTNKTEKFWISREQTIPVKMMKVNGDFKLLEDEKLKAKIVELEYSDKDFRMMVILPWEVDGLPELEAELKNVDLFENLKNLRRFGGMMDFEMPIFKLETTMDLGSTLKSQGVKTMFGDEADLSGMADNGLSVTKVVQKAFVDVNPIGTEAAAASAGVAATRMLRETLVSVNRPFLFLIMFKDTPLFIGRVTEPKA